MRKNNSRFIALASMFCALGSAHAQNYRPNYLLQANNFINNNFDIVDSSGWLQTLPESYVSFTNFIAQNKASLGMGPDDNFMLVKTTNDDYPFMDADKKMTHHRYNQSYKGMKVEYAELFVHHKNDSVKLLHGKLAEGLSLSIAPTITEAQAITAAIAYLGDTNVYTWQDTAWEASYKEEQEDNNATTYPTAELIIAKKNVGQNYAALEFVLAYKMSILSLRPLINVTIYINAHNGTFIKSISNIQEGNADLSYGYGTNKFIDTKWRGGLWSHHILNANDVSGRDVYTKKVEYNRLTFDVKKFGKDDKNNSHDDDDRWYSERAVETTPHWVITQTWDYFKNTFNRSSYDNAGMRIKIYADMIWDAAGFGSIESDIIYIGSIDGKHLGTKDICGHEYTHGVVKYASGLQYFGESGALNESFADIFGYEVERYLNGGLHTNWNIGEDSKLFRRMNNPSNSPISEGCAIEHPYAQPAFYKGDRWYYGSCGGDGVHINSGVQNYWFYLLTTGSTGAPDGTFGGVSVSGIGADKARNITYYNLDVFMGNNSGYNDARVGATFAANIIFGNCSNEEIQTRNAWAAVGLSSGKSTLAISGPSIVYITYAGGIVGGMPKTYTATGGESRRYSWTYTGPWIYNTSGTGFNNELFNITNFSGSYSSGSIQVKNGCQTLSKTISFKCTDCLQPHDNGFGASVSVSPNPATTALSITTDFVNPNSNENIIVTIVDMNGAYQFQQAYQHQLPQSINVANYYPGNYTLIVQQGNIVKQATFVKQ